MLQFKSAIFCLLFVVSFFGFDASSFAEDAPKPATPSEAEVKAMSEKLVGRFHLWGTLQSETQQILKDLHSLQDAGEKDITKIYEIFIRYRETGIKHASFYGLDNMLFMPHYELALAYESIGNFSKACEYFGKARDIAEKNADDGSVSLTKLFLSHCGNDTIQWKERVQKHLVQTQHSPKYQAHRETSTAIVKLVIDRNGKLISSHVAHSSGHTDLDAEALEMATRSQPFPTPPSELTDTEITLRVPIRFM